MVPRVKICGNATEADARLVAELAPDFMGYIFWSGSKRHVTPEAVRDWAKNLPPIPRVGVFVNATPDDVRHAVETAGLFAVQLHGEEDPANYAGLAQEVWKVVKIAPGQNVEVRNPKSESGIADSLIRHPADAYLLDTHIPNVPGGTGLAGDWNAARAFVAATPRPVLLAGGLTAENVREAIRAVGPWGVDVSSGVESAPAKKDLAKVAAFIAAARAG